MGGVRASLRGAHSVGLAVLLLVSGLVVAAGAVPTSSASLRAASPHVSALPVPSATSSVQAAVAPAGSAVPGWLNLTSPFGFPQYVEHPLMAYDPARSAVILIGGTYCLPNGLSSIGCTDGWISSSTWAYQYGHWYNITGAVGLTPPASGENEADNLAWDGATDQLVLWTDIGGGGIQPGGYPVYSTFVQTWVLGANGWQNISASLTDEPSDSGWMAYDPVDHYLVDLTSNGDTWVFANGTYTLLGNWSRVSGSHSPIPGEPDGSQLLWDPAIGRVLLYGEGLHGNTSWTFLDGHWTNVTEAGPTPPGVATMPMFYDGRLEGAVFYGSNQPGNLSAGAYTWIYRATGWTNITGVVGAPPPDFPSWGGTGADYPPTATFLGLAPAAPSYWPTPQLWAFSDDPVARITAEPSSVEVGGSFDMVAQVLGAQSPLRFNYTGLPGGCGVPTNLTFTCRPTETGAFQVSLNLTDATGAGANASTEVEVYPALGLTVNVSATAVDVGQPWNLSVAASGGLPSYAYTYYGLPPGCSGSGANVACTPEVPGNYTLGVTVTDSLGLEAHWSGALTVEPTPVLVVAVSEAEVEVGELETIAWTTVGGAPPLTVSFSGLPPGCSASPTTPITCRPTATGSYPVVVTAEDATGVEARTVAAISVVPALALERFSVGPSSAPVEGTSLLFVANVTGGIGALTFTYTGLPAGCASANASTFGCRVTTAGSWTVHVLVVDARGASAEGTLNLTVALTGGAALTLTDEVAIGGLAAAAVVVAVLLVVRRRRAPPSPSTGDEGPDESEPE